MTPTKKGYAVKLTRKHRKMDPDILVLKQCVRVLDRSSSKKMLRANLDFLVGHYADPVVVEK